MLKNFQNITEKVVHRTELNKNYDASEALKTENSLKESI